MGSPVVDEFGALVGMIGGPTVASATRLRDRWRLQAEVKGDSIVPFSSVRVPQSPEETTLTDLQAKGELALPLSGEGHIVSGGFARGITRSPPTPSGQRDDFSIADKQFVAFVNWTPVARLRGQTQLRVFDGANRLMVQSPSKKSDLRKGQFAMSFWEVPVPPAPGLYRVDVMFDGRPIWRGFVRITP